MGKILLKGGTVLSVDPDIGDRATGDVLIEDDTITAVEAWASVLAASIAQGLAFGAG